MPYEPFWLTAEQAERIHDEQISEWGGGTGIRDMGLLHSAIGRRRIFTHISQRLTFLI
jgi:hypothetical protein